jgi:glutamate/tyrosine decarboxylase-like PLP-dependent enzyme
MTPVFPERGELWPVLEERLIAARTQDTPWRKGLGHLYWPDPGGNVRLVAKAASDLMFESFLLGARYGEPSARLVEDEVMAMVLEILGAPEGAITTLTSGGTESNFHAVFTAREWAKINRPSTKSPTILLPFTAHPSFDKAAYICGLGTVRVPAGPDHRADVAAMRAAVTDDTIMVVGSAPPYSHGACDDIPGLADLAARHGLWMHVDACIAGFLIPFLRRLGCRVGPFDFAVPGVRSISADLHKQGLVLPHGISSFSLRDGADVGYQSFQFDQWPHGRYAMRTFAGSRSGHIVAAAWATLKHLGHDGYLRRAEASLRLADRLEAGLSRIEGFHLIAPCEAGVFVYAIEGVDMVALATLLEARRYSTSLCKQPPAIHLMLYPMEDERLVDDYVATVAELVADLRAGRTPAVVAEVGYA